MVTKIKATPFKVKPTIVIDSPAVDAPAAEEFSMAMPSTARLVISYVAAFCTGLGIGVVGGMLIEFLTLGALTLTGSLFIAIVIYVLAYLAMVYAAFIAGGWVGIGVLNGGVDKCYQLCSNTVRGWFSFNSFSTSKEAS